MPIISNRSRAQPIVVVREWVQRVLDASPEVLSGGVVISDPARRVEQVWPQAVWVPAQELLYQAQHDRIKSALSNFANATESAALGECLIEA
jgi:nucleotidyltransferase/DNA polymerase involved in DNA repair